MRRISSVFATMLALAVATAATAQNVELKTTAQVEVPGVDAAGNPTLTLAPAAKVVPGDVVLYTITATNIGAEPVDNIVVNDPIPEHMTYVADSAICSACEITYSVDGKSFSAMSTLTVVDDDGAVRKAEARDVRHVRWVFTSPLAPKATEDVSVRARLD